MRNYVAALGPKIEEVDAQVLKEHKIIAEFENDGRPDQAWTIRKSIIGSLVHEGGRYAVNEGEWFRVDELFKASIENAYSNLVSDWDIPPIPLRKEYDEAGNGKYQSEASYNAERAAALGYILLDTRSVEIPGVQRSHFEPCDMLDITGKKIHSRQEEFAAFQCAQPFLQAGFQCGSEFQTLPRRVGSTGSIDQNNLGANGRRPTTPSN